MYLKPLYLDGVSVVIVSHNGASRIKPVLEHLALQKAIYFKMEILLIDNNSTDFTAEIATKTWDNLGALFVFKVFKELRQGTMYARKKGINEACYRYILFCDDDNWLSCNYVSTAYNLIRANSQISAIGGKGVIAFENMDKLPFWANKFERKYGCGAQGSVDGDTTDGKMCLYTAGAILDRKWLNKLEQLGFSSCLSGRKGKDLVAGEDTELTFALKLIGGKLYYSSELIFQHYMPAKRMEWKYLRKLVYAAGFSDFIISSYPNYFLNKKYNNLFYSFTKGLILYTLLLAKIKYRNLGEGNKNVLLAEQYKGYLMAHLFAYKQYNTSKKTFKMLLKFIEKKN